MGPILVITFTLNEEKLIPWFLKDYDYASKIIGM